jgi:hypothetical protein
MATVALGDVQLSPHDVLTHGVAFPMTLDRRLDEFRFAAEAVASPPTHAGAR